MNPSNSILHTKNQFANRKDYYIVAYILPQTYVARTKYITISY